MVKPRTFFVMEHGKKERAYVEALKRAQWRQVGEPVRATISLFDSDGTHWRNERIARTAKTSKVVIYPHAAHPPFWYDCPGLGKPSDKVTMNIVPAAAHKKLLEHIHYPRASKVMGWSYCPMLPFHSSNKLNTVVFAPRHANGNGWLAPIDKQNNARAFDMMLELWSKYGFKLIVRHLGSLAESGLHPDAPTLVPGVIFVRGKPDLSHNELDQANLVVSTQTYAYLALARGKPTLMWGEQTPPHYGNSEETLCFAKHWDEYKQSMIYPYDLFCAQNVTDAWGLVQEAMRGDCPEAVEWRKNHIGESFKEEVFVETMERLRSDV